MITLLSVVALFLVAITMGLSSAHALEFTGKLRLEHLTLPVEWDFDATFAFGVSLILTGVEATVVARGKAK